MNRPCDAVPLSKLNNLAADILDDAGVIEADPASSVGSAVVYVLPIRWIKGHRIYLDEHPFVTYLGNGYLADGSGFSSLDNYDGSYRTHCGLNRAKY